MAVRKSSRRGKAASRSRKAAPKKRGKQMIGIEVEAPTAEVKKKLKEIFHEAAVANLGLSPSGAYSHQAPIRRGRR